MKFSWLQKQELCCHQYVLSSGRIMLNPQELYESIRICLPFVAGKLLLIYVAITILKFVSLGLVIASSKLHCHQSEPI